MLCPLSAATYAHRPGNTRTEVAFSTVFIQSISYMRGINKLVKVFGGGIRGMSGKVGVKQNIIL